MATVMSRRIPGMPIRPIGLLLCALLIATGCTTSGPATDVGYARVDDIHQLEGLWRNQGIGSASTMQVEKVYLSDLIWAPGAMPVPSSMITTISVKALDARTLEVKGLSGDEVLTESSFVMGEDFQLDGGRLILKRELDHDFSGEALGLWAMTSSIELGIDEEGQGKLRSRNAVGGLLLGVAPIAMGERNDVRFVRLQRPDPPRGLLPYRLEGGDGSSCTAAVRVLAGDVASGQRGQLDWAADMKPGMVPVGVLTIGAKLASDPVVQAEQAARLTSKPLADASKREQLSAAFTHEGAAQGGFAAARMLNLTGSRRYENEDVAIVQQARFELLTLRRPKSDGRSVLCFDVTSYTEPCCADDKAYYQYHGCERLGLELAAAEDDAKQLAEWVAIQKDQTTGKIFMRQTFALAVFDAPERYDPLIGARHQRALRVRDAIAAAMTEQGCPVDHAGR